MGLVLTVAALLSISALTPVLGDFFGFILPLAVVLFILIILHPYAPKVLNNVGFAYLTVACIDIPALTAHLPQFFITFIVGSVLFNGVCVLLMKPAKALAVRSVEKQSAEKSIFLPLSLDFFVPACYNQRSFILSKTLMRTN